ncbi:hypothetical protein RB608_09540 [Nocardioides sp. LHD-245]|uniref:hypothetical protein n=1 Tax=Nocardioides sp. LHD-245 TaxID=3051387 RepID=UPI0027DFE44A|nr:hypothetical protein [Nocardioides sp. LHD-245]
MRSTPPHRGFVGRRAETGRCRRFLASDSAHTTLLVHGPGGIGKSALLDEIAVLGAEAGYEVHRWMGAELAGGIVELDALGSVAAGSTPAQLLLVDGCDELVALWLQLRLRVGQRTAPGNRLVIASRETPEQAWHRPGWDARALSLPLLPFTADEAEALALARGVTDPADRTALVAWSAGLPLAVTLAADAVATGLSSAALAGDPDLATILQTHVVGGSLSADHLTALTVAAIAGEFDGRTLAAGAPGIDTADAEAWLRGLSFVSPVGSRLRIHDSVRHVVQSGLAASGPDQDAEIRRRLADHHVRRAVAGEPASIVEMNRLVRDPVLRYGLGSHQMGRRYQVTTGRPDDFIEVATHSGYDDAYLALLRRWFHDAPGHVVVTRDETGALAGWGIAATLFTHPAWIEEDPVLGPWFRVARAAHPDEDAFLVRDVADVGAATDEISPILAAGYAWCIQRMAHHNPRYSYACTSDSADTPTAGSWLAAMGYLERPELAVTVGRHIRRCYVTDHGEAGMAGDTWRTVYRDIGLPDLSVPPLVDVRTALRHALRHFHDPVALADNALAPGGAARHRVEGLRSQILAAITAEFGDGAEDQLLRSTLELTYLATDGSPQSAIRALPVSRSSYYRRIEQALGRLAHRFTG